MFRSTDWPRWRLRGWRAGVLGAACLALAFGVRLALAPWMGGLPFITFFVAVLVTAVFAGWVAATAVAAASLLTAWYAFLPPAWSWETGATGLVALGFFALVAGAQILAVALLERAVEALREERARVEGLLEHQRVLYRELQHRVANGIQTLASILAVQAAQVADADDAEAALREAAERLRRVAAVHRRLHEPGLGGEGFSRALEALMRDVLAAAGREDVVTSLAVGAAPERQDVQAIIAMTVAEALANALRYAFAGREGGRVAVRLDGGPGGAWVLSVTDDGPGFGHAAVRPGLGLQIISGFAARLGGVLETRTGEEGGAELRLSWREDATRPAGAR